MDLPRYSPIGRALLCLAGPFGRADILTFSQGVESRRSPTQTSGSGVRRSVAQAACTLVNNKGTWYLTSPGTVAVHRSYQDLNVTCKKEGVDLGVVAVKSSTKAM